jgi:3-phosphoshikimate 1-carboxyvinyltransferase
MGGVLVSRPYVDLTLQVMRAFGAEADWTSPSSLRVKAGRGYRGRPYEIEPDASSAVYPFCAAAITGGRARVTGIPPESIQADAKVLDVLASMGCEVRREAGFCEVRGPVGRLRAVSVDMNEMPDAALAVAVTALFAGGPSELRNIANLRLKETDRLHALETELRKHRMAMAFALAGLRIPGVAIRDPACVRKTWPDYFEMLEAL